MNIPFDENSIFHPRTRGNIQGSPSFYFPYNDHPMSRMSWENDGQSQPGRFQASVRMDYIFLLLISMLLICQSAKDYRPVSALFTPQMDK